MSSETYHEPIELLSEETKNMHRAISSLMEELEAVDWYQQRAEATTDAELRAVLTHNKNEEIEHAMMVLEWIRRKNPVFDTNIGTYLNSKGPITQVEKQVEKLAAASSGSKGGASNAADESDEGSVSLAAASLGIGSLKNATVNVSGLKEGGR